jgi:uncharacterized protein (DUF1499 family)
VDKNSGNGKDLYTKHSVVAFVGLLVAVLACFAAMMSGPGSRIGFWHFRTGFEILKGSGYLALLAVVVSAAGAVICLKQKRKGLLLAIPGLVLGLAVVGLLIQLRLKVQDVPPIHDITTDIVNPPQFVDILPLRRAAPNPATYGGPEIALKQMQAYPDIKPLVLGQPFEQAFESARATARSMGWNIVAEDKKDGRIEATATTFWFGFTDDIVVRITPVGLRTIIDILSVSRVGRSDVGTNAERIRIFLEKLRHNV